MASVADFLAAHADGALVALDTSGTSGAARAVIRTTDSWVSSFATVTALSGLSAAARVWVPGPRGATMNLYAAVHATVLGAALVDDPADATHAHLTPAALARGLDDGVPLGGVTVVVAGDRMDRPLHDRAVEAGARVHHYYGAAELSFVAWGTHADDLRPFPGVEVTVRGGEIWVRSGYLCSGYDGRPGALRVGSDGFATVGDRGVLTDGRLTVSGRPEAVNVGGSTVELADVEAVLRARALGGVCVVGLPHDVLGRVLAAVLTAADDRAALQRVARNELVGAARPRLWFQLDRLPMTAAGKLDRGAVASLLTDPGGPARRLV